MIRRAASPSSRIDDDDDDKVPALSCTQVLCEPYWPALDSTQGYGQVEVTTLSQSCSQDWRVSQLKLYHVSFNWDSGLGNHGVEVQRTFTAVPGESCQCC